MSTTSKVGGVFNALGSGISAAGPIGAGIGAGLSVLGSIMGMGGQRQDKKREEEERKKQELEAQRQSIMGPAEPQTAERTAQAQAPPAPVGGGMQPQQQQQNRQFGSPEPVASKGFGADLGSMILGGNRKNWWQDG